MKSKAQSFADTIKDNPQEITEWCRAEIREYERLIKILEKHPSGASTKKSTRREEI